MSNERSLSMKACMVGLAGLVLAPAGMRAQPTQPLVAIHDSELTRALDSSNSPAISPTPTGAGTTGLQWWVKDWHYFVMPESLKEGLRSDGTAFTVVGDSNITAGVLLANGVPRYPILISLCSEAIRNDEIAQLTNYVAAGGFLIVGGSAFTRNTNGTTRGDFAFANELGLHMAVGNLSDWAANTYFLKTNQASHRLVSHIPAGSLTWRMPSSSEEIPWGLSPSHPFMAPHDIWKVQANGATVLAVGDASPFLTVKAYGKGYFIYCAAMQPLVGHSGFAPSMYAYLIFRRAIEWAFETAKLPVPKLSPWPYQYDAAFMVRHDLENFTNEMANIELSAAFEFTNGAKGDYYFCTGTVRDDATPGGYNTNTMVAGMRRAVTNYGATLGPHNGGLKNPSNGNLVRGQYDYWHWGPDEALDFTPSGYSSGKAYALTSLTNSFRDVEGWLKGINLPPRTWVACNFNATREDSYDLQVQAGVKIAGDQKITPFPHWTISTVTPNKRYAMLTEPVSDWFVGGLVAQSLEPWHPPGVQTSQTMHAGVDFYYNLGALVNFYSHTMSTGLGDAGALVPDYVAYCANSVLHPRMWAANAVGVYQWWLQRSNAQVTATFSTNAGQSMASFAIKGATDANTAVEILVPATVSICALQVYANGVLASTNSYRSIGQTIRMKVGTTITNAVITYYPLSQAAQIYSQAFDGVTAPALPAGWTTSASGAQTAWVTQTGSSDSAPNVAFSADGTAVGINELVSPVVAIPPGLSQVSFRHSYDLEDDGSTSAYDGGVLELKVGANPFADILAAGGSFVSGGYTDTIVTNYSNPLGGRQAWSGTSSGFITTTVNLPASAAGQNIQLKWRCATDTTTGRTGWRVDTLAITSQACLCCGSTNTNTAPVLPAQGNRTISELTFLGVTNTATDADIPANNLNYALVSPPAGAAIDAQGVITWTPSEAQGPGTYALTTVVTDDGFPPLSATNSFAVTVNEINSAPVLPSQGGRTIAELMILTVTNTATDSDLPANTLTYSLLAAPGNATISANGVITWTPTEAQGPSTNTFTTRVFDNGSPTLSATNNFTVVVSEVNSAPVLPAQGDRTIAALSTLTVTNSATDADLPANTLIYSLLTAPAGAAVSTGGIITWTPSQAQNHSTNLFRTKVGDDGAPPLAATNTFTVVVNLDPVIKISSTTLAQEGCAATNNAIDPGETVTVLFALQNIGNGNTTNLVVSLLATNGVVPASGSQAYGALVAGAPAVTLPFTFAATGACGGAIVATLQLQDGSANLGTATASFALGANSVILTQNLDSVAAPSLPAGWTTVVTGGDANWFTTNSLADTAPNAAFVSDPVVAGTSALISPAITLPLGASQLTFKHRYALESMNASTGYDGGVLEIKIGAAAFADIVGAGGSFTSGGYNTTISAAYSSPITNRQAWSGTNGGYSNVVVNLPASAAGQLVQLRWLMASDNGGAGGGWRVDSVGIAAAACCLGGPPILPGQPNRTVAELTALTITNTATSSAGGLSYSLIAPPVGVLISGTGVITWTPTEAQGPGTNVLTTVVTDNGVPPLSATNSFTVVVTEVNSAPVLPSQAGRTVAEQATLVVTNVATDSDLPVNVLTYTLLNPPAGAGIGTNSGVLTWTPSEAQGPGTNVLTTIVTDNGVPPLSATNSFTVVVTEVNSEPVLPSQAGRTIAELATLVVTNVATDSDLPANVLTYALLNPPAGAGIGTNSGVITWTPSEAQGPGTNVLATIVTDNGVPPLSSTNSFTVVVTEVNSSPVLPSQVDRTVAVLATMVVTNVATDSDLPPNVLTYNLLNPPAGAVIGTNSGVITWTPTEAQAATTNTITTVVVDDGFPSPLSATNNFVVVTLALPPPPVLLSLDFSNSVASISWSSVAGYHYRVEYKASLEDPDWIELPPMMTASGPIAVKTDLVAGVDQRFYRVVLVLSP